MATLYPTVCANPLFPDIEREVLEYWHKDKTFLKSIKGSREFVFYDGPPFANGLPHYGHFLSGFIKDIVARYQTMQDHEVNRRFGWDCHGLPAEMEVEKELSVSGKKQIEELGVGYFNNCCRKSVLKYEAEWEKFVTRQARWVDFKHGYKTMDLSYMESVLWAFKTLYDKGLIYKAMRVMPYSWKCETPVSDFETRMDNAYREKQSKSVTVAVKFKDSSLLGKVYAGLYILIWTTTPWTLPSNLAIAIGEDIEYGCFLQKNGSCYIIASALAARYSSEIGGDLIATFKGADIMGLEYEPLFPYFKGHKTRSKNNNAFRILAADFVTTDEGTGAVHIAPGFGEEDHELCNRNSIELVCPVDESGCFIQPVSDFLGVQVFEANDPIIKYLKSYGMWIRTEQYTHNYPHCWRTDTPLIYRAISSWYVKVTDLKVRMLKNNEQINWVPGHIKKGLFGKWLENARDWSISRNRFWGTPIPVWESDDPRYPCTEVYGSIAELEKAFKVTIDDLHRPAIDALTKPNPNDPTGCSLLRRVPEVLDCWFESGSMPYAQVHFPFENQNWFSEHFPADFITEYIAQTRGWFYTLMVLSTALFDKPPFLNCICHGVILGEGGQKLSKRLKNYPDPAHVFEKIGADAMRWFMVSSQVMKSNDLSVDKEAKCIESALQSAIKPLWHAYHFFTLYANADSIQARFDLTSDVLLDRYIITKCKLSALLIERSMGVYDTVVTAKVITEFLEILNNWYIRRSRDRFWRSEQDANKIWAYNTLYSVLHIVCRAAAPLLPLITEAIYRGINKPLSNESVHLQTFPHYIEEDIDHNLIACMDRVRAACNATLHIRNEQNIRIRQPLSKVLFVGIGEEGMYTEELRRLILDEVNVKEWHSVGKSCIEQYAIYKLQLNLPILGKRIPWKVKQILNEVKLGKWSAEEGAVVVAGERLQDGEYVLLLEPKEEYKGRVCALNTQDGLVVLDLEISGILKMEGIARDVVRVVQQSRKEAGYYISDSINLSIYSESSEIREAITAWSEYIKEQTWTDNIRIFTTTLGAEDTYKYIRDVKLDCGDITIALV